MKATFLLSFGRKPVTTELASWNRFVGAVSLVLAAES
jgi:hypothetical protein